jgi:hypothetical protein
MKIKCFADQLNNHGRAIMIQLKALYAIAIALALLPFQAAFAEVDDITISGVEFRDPFDRSIGGPPTATQLMLSANLTNNSAQPLPYVAFIELRDSDGITIYLEFHKGRLDPRASSSIASSSTPKTTGEYDLRVFAISDLQNPQILSTVGTATTTIS